MRLRVVLDTQVWLDWLHFRDPRCEDLARRFDRGELALPSSAPCRDEWQRVLGYPALNLGPAERERLASAYDQRCSPCAEPDTEAPLPRLPRCRDPDDQKFIELAVRAGAKLLLSRDRALLDLHRRLHREFGIAVAPPQPLERLLHSEAR
ncbi:PIN domain-containing protein [Pseudomarimonas salicorniae]|uniref:PIN domain-containing protein n=1 Tax=Pseudomarimonas salicorniae TaxID=2933270 RepID=A0ABT0GK76_9GAMM|nr:PIN domain-containing protein [Lysobacter sp. CAU 1642]MCK7594447.1 PIN domain-containing protein [Lysobacter sp. CAU 1642]